MAPPQNVDRGRSERPREAFGTVASQTFGVFRSRSPRSSDELASGTPAPRKRRLLPLMPPELAVCAPRGAPFARLRISLVSLTASSKKTLPIRRRLTVQPQQVRRADFSFTNQLFVEGQSSNPDHVCGDRGCSRRLPRNPIGLNCTALMTRACQSIAETTENLSVLLSISVEKIHRVSCSHYVGTFRFGTIVIVSRLS